MLVFGENIGHKYDFQRGMGWSLVGFGGGGGGGWSKSKEKRF